ESNAEEEASVLARFDTEEESNAEEEVEEESNVEDSSDDRNASVGVSMANFPASSEDEQEPEEIQKYDSVASSPPGAAKKSSLKQPAPHASVVKSPSEAAKKSAAAPSESATNNTFGVNFPPKVQDGDLEEQQKPAAKNTSSAKKKKGSIKEYASTMADLPASSEDEQESEEFELHEVQDIIGHEMYENKPHLRVIWVNFEDEKPTLQSAETLVEDVPSLVRDYAMDNGLLNHSDWHDTLLPLEQHIPSDEDDDDESEYIPSDDDDDDDDDESL
ncbi:MAG: hypothetical protein SGARI_001882, partial [Bacillariaceae sp.]